MFTVGQVIKNERFKSRITQEELSDGICTPSYLSRLENGQVNPSPDIVKLLLERLGKDYNKYITYKSEYEYGLDQLKFDIRRYHALGDYEKFDAALEEMEKFMSDEDKFTKQFYQLYSVFQKSRNGVSPALLIEALNEALHLTKTKIDLLRLSKEFLTQIEVVIINNIAIQVKAMGDIQRAIDILLELKRYLEQPHIDHDQITRTHPIILCNLCKWLASEKRYYECLMMCDLGLNYCLKYGFLDIFADVNFYKGFALEHVGQKDMAKKFVVQSYYIAQALNSDVHADLIKTYISEHHEEVSLLL